MSDTTPGRRFEFFAVGCAVTVGAGVGSLYSYGRGVDAGRTQRPVLPAAPTPPPAPPTPSLQACLNQLQWCSASLGDERRIARREARQFGDCAESLTHLAENCRAEWVRCHPDGGAP